MIPRRIRFWYESAGKDAFPGANKKAYGLCVTESTITKSVEREIRHCIDGNGGTIKSIETGASVSGSVTSAGVYETVGFFLRGLMGTPETAAAGSKFSHVFTPSLCEKYIAAEHIFENGSCGAPNEYLINRFTGLKLIGMSTSVQGKGAASFSWDVSGSAMKDSQSGEVDPETGNQLIPGSDLTDNGTVVVAGQGLTDTVLPQTEINTCDAFLEIDDVAVKNIGELQLKYTLNTAEQDLISCGKSVSPTSFEISGSLSGVWDASVYQKFAQKNATVKLVAGYQNAQGDTLKFTLPQVAITLKSAPLRSGENFVLDAEFTATTKDGSTPTMTVELVNNVAEYAD